MELKKILVAVDFSEASNRAFEQARLLAGTDDVELHVVHRLVSPMTVFPPVAPTGSNSLAEIGRILDDYMAQAREEAVQTIEALLAGTPDNVVTSYTVAESGTPVEALEEAIASFGPDLLVLGAHGKHGLEKVMLGSVASEMLHHADVPVLLVREDSELYGAEAAAGTILAPVDFSDHSQRALAVARSLAQRNGASLHVVHAVELLHTPFTPGGLTSRFEAEPGLQEKTLTALREMLGDAEGEVEAEDGSPASVILARREALGASLVVMGSRGLTGLKGLLLGSVAEKVARFCEVPVLVVR